MPQVAQGKAERTKAAAAAKNAANKTMKAMKNAKIDHNAANIVKVYDQYDDDEHDLVHDIFMNEDLRNNCRKLYFKECRSYANPSKTNLNSIVSKEVRLMPQCKAVFEKEPVDHCPAAAGGARRGKKSRKAKRSTRRR
jgi:hypothetical protein